MVYFLFTLVVDRVVLVEQGIAQVTPSNSPRKVSAPLKVATPQSRGRSTEVGTPNDPPLQIDEGITIETFSNSSLVKVPDPTSITIHS